MWKSMMRAAGAMMVGALPALAACSDHAANASGQDTTAATTRGPSPDSSTVRMAGMTPPASPAPSPGDGQTGGASTGPTTGQTPGSASSGQTSAPGSSGKGTGAAGVAVSTMAGVYSASQASQGRQVYRTVCARCHTTPQHSGGAFEAAWNNRRLYDLYEILTNSMPQDDPGSLEPRQYLAVMAYLLELNGMPAGKKPLRADTAALKRIRITIGH